VRIGDFAAVSDSDYHAVVPGTAVRVAPVTLEQGCWIGRGALALPGVTMGAGSVVAAGAVVDGVGAQWRRGRRCSAAIVSRFDYDRQHPRDSRSRQRPLSSRHVGLDGLLIV
jgi:acetyltransferase-like isoleucine patch superfamily enzyme